MQKITNLIGFIIVAAAIAAVSFYGINKFYALKVAEANEQIDFNCAQNYRYSETLKNGATVSYPMEKEYKDCVTSKVNLN